MITIPAIMMSTCNRRCCHHLWVPITSRATSLCAVQNSSIVVAMTMYLATGLARRFTRLACTRAIIGDWTAWLPLAIHTCGEHCRLVQRDFAWITLNRCCCDGGDYTARCDRTGQGHRALLCRPRLAVTATHRAHGRRRIGHSSSRQHGRLTQ